MTTEDSVEAIDPIEEEPEKPRDLSELLTLDTYQGMTDEEIEIVIEHKCRIYLTSQIAKTQIDATNKAALEYGQAIQETNDLLERSRKLLEDSIIMMRKSNPDIAESDIITMGKSDFLIGGDSVG